MDRITSAILLLIAALVVHLVEEVKTGFRKKLPIGEMPRLLFIGINLVVYAFCFTTLFLSARSNELAIPLAWVFAILGKCLETFWTPLPTALPICRAASTEATFCCPTSEINRPVYRAR